MTRRIAKNHKAKAVLLIAVIGGGSSPVLADCCDSFIGCAATIVTYGVSCEIETIISTIEGLITVINNVVDIATGTTSTAVNAAKAWFHTTHDYLQSQSQQGAANLVAAAAQAQAVYKQETMIEPAKFTDGTQSSQLARTNAPTAPPSSTAQKTAQLAVRQPVSALSAPPPPPPAANAMERTVNAPANKVVPLMSTLPAHGAFADTFALAVKQITALQTASANDLPTINQYLQKAEQTEGSGELTAAGIAENAINAPLNSVKDFLSNLLAHPASAFDPTSQVQTMEDSVMSQLQTNVGKMVDNVTQGPDAAFHALGPSFGQLLESAQRAQAIATAMDHMQKQRTPAAIQALDALLPKQSPNYASKSTTVSASLNMKLANGMSYNDLMSQSSALRQKATVSVTASVQKFHSLAATLKTQVAQSKLAQTPSMLQTYQGKLNQQLSTAFDGKPASAVNAQRDQFIAQARTRYAKDPKTENAVIALLNSEAAKRTGAVASTGSAMQAPTATMTPSAAMKTQAQSSSLQKPVPAMTTLAPAAAAPVVPVSQAKPTAWGSAPPAWTPPSAVKTPMAPASTLQPATPGAALPGMKMMQPVKPPPVLQPSTIPAAKAAPSSISGQ